MGSNMYRLEANVLGAPSVLAHGNLCECHQRLVSRDVNAGSDHGTTLVLCLRGISIPY